MKHCWHVLQTWSTSNLQLPTDSSVAVPQIQRLILKGRGFEKWPYNESPELHSSCHKFCVLMVVSDCLRSILIWCKFQIFTKRACPQTPLERCALCMHRQLFTICAPHQPPLCMYAPLLQSLDPPLKHYCWELINGKCMRRNICHPQKWPTVYMRYHNG